jgi:hypothetical protein
MVGLPFTPQDGDSFPSSIAATLCFLYPDSYDKQLEVLNPYFFREI